MKSCPNCGKVFDDSARFCDNCGYVLPDAPQQSPSGASPSEAAQPSTPSAPGEVCPRCGSPVAPGYAFCSVCGAPIASAAPASPTQAPDPDKTTVLAHREDAAPAGGAAPASDSVPVGGGDAAASGASAPEVPRGNGAQGGTLGSAPGAGYAAPGAGGYSPAETPLPGAGGAAAKPKKKGKKGLIICIAILLVLAIALAAVLLLRGGGGSKQTPLALYVKDGELTYHNLKKGKEGQELSSDWSAYNIGGSEGSLLRTIVFSQDGKYVFYPEDFGGDGSFALYYKAVNKPKSDPVRVDREVVAYMCNEKATTLTYLKDSGALYRYDLKKDEEDKIAGDVASFFASADGESVLYITDEGDLVRKVGDGEEEKLSSGVTRVEWISDDLENVLYLRDETLYLQKGSKDRAKVSSDVQDVVAVYDTGELYYVTEDGRDTSLYYYNGKKETLLTDEATGNATAAADTPVIVYEIWEDEGDDLVTFGVATKGKAGEISLDDDCESGEVGRFRLSPDGKTVYYLDNVEQGAQTSSGYWENDEGELYRASVSGGKLKGEEKVDDGVTGYGYMKISKLGFFYFKGDHDLCRDGKQLDDEVTLVAASDAGLLYLTDDTLKIYDGDNAVKIADDVTAASFAGQGGKTQVLYLTDVDSRGEGELHLYSGGKDDIALDDGVTVLFGGNRAGSLIGYFDSDYLLPYYYE